MRLLPMVKRGECLQTLMISTLRAFVFRDPFSRKKEDQGGQRQGGQRGEHSGQRGGQKNTGGR